MKLPLQKTALWTGVVIAGLHAVWATLVFFGFAQGYLDWILGLHFLNNPYTVMPFSWASAIWLLAFTFIVGYALGYLCTLIWNKMIKK